MTLEMGKPLKAAAGRGQNRATGCRYDAQNAEKTADDFEREFVQRMHALRVGDPFDESTQLRPLANADAVIS